MLYLHFHVDVISYDIYLSLFDLLHLVISRSIYVASDDIILSFFMTE